MCISTCLDDISLICYYFFLFLAIFFVHPVLFLPIFQCCVFLQSFHLSQYVTFSLFSLNDRIRLRGICVLHLCVFVFLVLLFHLISLPFMKFSLELAATFLLPPVSFAAVALASLPSDSLETHFGRTTFMAFQCFFVLLLTIST